MFSLSAVFPMDRGSALQSLAAKESDRTEHTCTYAVSKMYPDEHKGNLVYYFYCFRLFHSAYLHLLYPTFW